MRISNKYKRLLLTLGISAMSSAISVADTDNSLRAPRSGGDIISMPSVETAALCRHTEHNVNHATGQATISMPLYTLTCGDMSLPITIEYMTGGVKVDDEDGPVGVSWDLQCGGAISRRIAGRPDEVDGAMNIPSGTPTLEYLIALDHYTTDSDYDRYNYRAGSYSGTFIIKGENIVQLPESDVKIIRTNTGIFKITIPDGTEYVYDVTETVSYRFIPIIIDGKQFFPDYDDIVCQWRPGRIINPSRTDSITFEYTDMASRKRYPSSSPSSIYASDRDTQPVGISHYSGQDGLNRHIYNYNNRHGLSRIKSRAGTINFIDAAHEPVKGFTVNTPDGKEVRRIVFDYTRYNSRTKHGIALLNKVTIKADGQEIDGATFEYYSPKSYMGNRDIFGYNNYRSDKIYPTESILDVKIQEEPRDSIGHIILPGDLDDIVTNQDADITTQASAQRANIVISECRLPDFDAMQSKSLKSFTTYAGATTEFTYEKNEAAQKFKIDGTKYNIAPGLRIKREQTTNHTTGNIRIRDYTYSGGVSTIDFSKFHYSSFIGLSGSRGLVDTGAILVSETKCTTGAILSTSSLMPGDIMEDASVYYSNVRETMTGSGLDSPVVTDYTFDTANVGSPYISAGMLTLSESQMNDKRYCGTNIMFYAHSQFHYAYGCLLSPQIIGGYFRQTFREKAPLIKKTEWIADSCGSLERPLRVTDYIYSSEKEKIFTTGYYSTPLVRTIDSPILGHPNEDYQSINDFNYFPVTVATCKSWCDSVRTTEYDLYGNSRTVVTTYEYNNHKAQSNTPKRSNIFEVDSTRVIHPGGITTISGRNSLISKISKSCGGDVYSTDYEYSCNVPIGPLARAAAGGRISMPVKEIYRHGTFMLEKRYNYTDFGTGSGGLQLSSLVCAAHGAVLTDSISITGYDRYGNPTSIIGFDGRKNSYRWGGSGTFLEQVTTDGNFTTKYEYSPLVGYTQIKSPSGMVTTYGYSAGRLASVTSAGENVTAYSYSQYGTDNINKIETSHIGANGNTVTDIVRFDAFGNKILVGKTGRSSIVNITKYDIFGRKLREYLPVGCDNPDNNLNWIAEGVAAAYDGDSEAVREYGYMSGNDGRVRTVTIGGEEFAAHPMRSDYRFNAGDDGDALYRCRKYSVDGNSLVCDGYYDKGTLAIKESTDGDGRKALTFTDFSGKVILSRAVTDGVSADTYSIYNDAGDLALVLPPMASSKLTAEGKRYNISSDETLLGYADLYRYDDRLLLTERRMAGTEPVIYRHDAAGRLVLTQDGEQRARGVTGFAILDYYGRPALEGEALATSQLMDGIRNHRPYALRTQTLSGRHAGYGVSLSMSNAVIDKAYYYDDYGFLSESYCAGIDSVLSAKPLTVKRSNNRGLLTGCISRVNSAADFDGSVIVSGYSGDYIAEAFGYDSRGRVAESVSVDPQGVAVRESVTHSSSGLPLSSVTQRFAPEGTVEKLAFAYTYDDFERQTSVTTSVNDVEMARSITVYDGIGRTASVILKDLRGENTETVSYSYLTNGAVKSIATASGSLTMTLKYASGAVPSYSGNISGMEWKGADRVQRSYTYGYDGLNRLISAQYAESGRPTYSHLMHSSAPDYSCSYSYDLNGNPRSVVRKGLTEVMGSGSSHLLARFGTVDNLTFKYSGNQLTKVSDSASSTSYTGASDFYDNNYLETEYEYDANGNMTMDFNRKIMGVVYNRLNQPVRVEIGNGSFVENLYDADGGLRQRRLRQKAAGIPTIGGFFPADSIDSEGNYIRVTDYCGPWEFVNGRLSCVRIPGGYIEGDSVYFHISDHQGNIRQIWNATTGQTVQDNHYYPYGALLGESASTEYVKAVARGNRHPVSTNLYKYSAKEWQPAFGLNLYDFIARQYDPALCRFTSPDPLNSNYPQLSPYLYCAANPINFSDPTGLAVIYDMDGSFLGNSKEGFTGEILFYQGNDKIDFSKYNEYELKESTEFILHSYGDVVGRLSNNAQTAVWNNVISHFEGISIYGLIFGMNKIQNGRIMHLDYNTNSNTSWRTIFYTNSLPLIYGTGGFIEEYEATVENIASSILIHEWFSHGRMHYSDTDRNHRLAYKNVINYSPLWDMTTDKYKGFILDKFQYYSEQETGNRYISLFYMNLYNKFIKYYQK